MSKHSEACCKIPPITDDEYEPKGSYITVAGLKTYVTGPEDAKQAILSVYDIFGFRNQIFQGADILAYSDTERPYRVYMPDFFNGNTAKFDWYPPDTEEKQQALYGWLGEVAAPPKHLPKVQEVVEAIKEISPKSELSGIIGYCWGGKMVSILAGQDGPFKAGIQSSPAMVDAADGAKVKIPMMMLASKDETVEDVKAYEDSLKVAKHIERFADQAHGFMSARADLKDEKMKAEYIRGYKLALQFFHDHL